MNTKNGFLVVIGVGSDEKPHGARFNSADESLVRKAAGLMNFRVGAAETDDARALVKKLPAGRIFAAGRAFVPYIKQDLYDKLIGVLNFEPIASVDAAAAESPQASSQEPAAHAHDPWAELKVGSVVLCRDDSDEPAWWESVVVAVGRDGETMTMRWRDYPKVKKFTVKRHGVGLIGAAPTK